MNLIIIALFSSRYQTSRYVQVEKKKTCWGQQIKFKDMIQLYKQKQAEKTGETGGKECISALISLKP